jgi:hypothetical protein
MRCEIVESRAQFVCTRKLGLLVYYLGVYEHVLLWRGNKGSTLKGVTHVTSVHYLGTFNLLHTSVRGKPENNILVWGPWVTVLD